MHAVQMGKCEWVGGVGAWGEREKNGRGKERKEEGKINNMM